MLPLLFSKRTTVAVTIFACLFAAQNAQLLTTNAAQINALYHEYATLFSLYRRVIHQDVPNQERVLDRIVAAARKAICQLNSTVQSITLAEAQAAAIARAVRNSYPGAVNQNTGFQYADAAVALNNAQQFMKNALAVMANVELGELPMQTQAARVMYTITATDILNGFIPVPVVWPTPFADTNYTAVFAVNDLDATVDLSIGVLDMHNKTASGVTCVALLAAAYPLVQGQLDALDVTTAQDVTLVAPISTLFQVTVYAASHGGGSSGDIFHVYIEYTDASGIGQQTYDLGALTGNATGYVEDLPGTSPIYAVQGTTIRVYSALTAGSPFAYDMSVRIVQMPSNSVVIEPGDQFVINAIAIHDPSVCG
jgi:hypothetical protein